VKTSPPVPRLASIDRSQLLLRPVDVERLIDEDHCARSIWQLIGRLDLSLYHAEIAAVEGSAGRDHTSPQLLISLWLYAYSRGISSARELARQCEFEPGAQWLCGLEPISHRTLSGFRSEEIRDRRKNSRNTGRLNCRLRLMMWGNFVCPESPNLRPESPRCPCSKSLRGYSDRPKAGIRLLAGNPILSLLPDGTGTFPRADSRL
jgi:transposase